MENRDNFKKMIDKAREDDNLIIHTKGYMFDSLVYRFKDYQARAFQMEVVDYKNSYNMSELDARKKVKDKHDRDLMRFIEILNEAIGEHD